MFKTAVVVDFMTKCIEELIFGGLTRNISGKQLYVNFEMYQSNEF